MLEQIAQLVKQFGQDSVVNNPDVPAQENQEVMAEATRTITSGLQNILAGGGLASIISLFTDRKKEGQSSSIANLLKNPIVIMMIGHLVSKLISKYKMSPVQASNISNSLIPNVLNSLVNKTVDDSPENDAFDLNDLISSLSGGNVATAGNGVDGYDFQGLLRQLTSGQDTSPGFGLDDIITHVTQATQKTQADNTGDGITGLLKTLFK